MSTIRRVYQAPPLRNGGFTPEQQRALNDLFLQLSELFSGTNGARTLTQSPLAGTAIVTFQVGQASDDYAFDVRTTWWTMWKINAQTASALTLEFSNLSGPGDRVMVDLG